MLADFFSSLLTDHLLLKGRGTTLTAETVGLPSDHFCHRGTTRNEDMADRVLHHLVFALRQTIRLPSPSELPQRTSNKEVEDDEENKGENNPIHRGWEALRPQSYVRASGLSRMSLYGFTHKSTRFVPFLP